MTSLDHWFISSTHASTKEFSHRPGKLHVYVQYQKEDHAKDVTEFKPISMLCILPKVFERVILHQLCHFLEVKAHYNQT